MSSEASKFAAASSKTAAEEIGFADLRSDELPCGRAG
jgi:hypothetical protein